MNSDYLVGAVIENRYEIVEMIGSGGMATVYKARCKVLNRYVAIKVLKDSLKYDQDVVKRFNAESRAAACLSHPNIVQVHDVSENDGLDYIVMEYVDGITLKDYIAKKGRLEWQEACNFAIQIGKALECAHKNHIIHRDIKPHNILMTKDGILKVADFGIAQATSSDTIVAGGGNMGSAHYISPEQGRGGYTDERSDIYSLGVVMYEMLTGRLPFDGENPVAIAIMKLEKDPVDCKIVNPTLPNSVCKMTMKAISREQHSRYQQASEMVADLEKTVKNSLADIDSDDGGKFETHRINKDKTREEFYMRKEEKRRKRNQKQGLIYTLVLVILAAVIGLGTYLFMTSGRKEYQVPNLENLTLEEAEQVLKEANLVLSGEIEYEESDEIDEDHIIRQTPGVNQFVKKNRKIKVVVSIGGENGKIEVPDVTDIPLEKAQRMLEKAELQYTVEEKYDEDTKIGYVISQSPKEGVMVKEGYSVKLYVCGEDEENEQVVVPKLTGYTEAQAKALLEEAGLVPGTVDKEQSSAPAGTVISQNPAAKTGVVKASKVNFTLSSGEEEKPVLKKKTLTITIPDDANETVHIKVVANDKVIHDKVHQKSEGTVDIVVQASKDANVKAYIDNMLVVDKVITFE